MRGFVKFILLCLVLTGNRVAPASERKNDVIFYVGFEKTDKGYGQDYIYPNIFRSKNAPLPTTFEYGQGVIGLAADFVWDAGYPGIAFPVVNNFDVNHGTISLWIRKTRDFFINRWYPMIHVPLGREGFSGMNFVPLNDPRVAVIEDGHWHHFVYTWNAADNEKKQYLNGALIFQGNYRELSAQRHIVFGYRLPGSMDELVILKKPLTAVEVKDVYESYKKGIQPFRVPAPSKKLFPIDIAGLPKERPPLPNGTDWEMKASEKNEKRVLYELDGLWRFQPVDFKFQEEELVFDFAIQEKKLVSRGGFGDEWGYVKAPGLWQPRGSIIDENGNTSHTWQGRTLDSYPGAWYERDFNLPEKHKDCLILLNLKWITAFSEWHSAGNTSHLYLNGRYIGSILPQESKQFDLTPYVFRDKPNRISILNGLLYAGLESAGMIAAPKLEIRDCGDFIIDQPLITTSYRKQNISLVLPIQNLSKKDIALQLTPEIYDFRENTQVEILPSVQMDIPKDFIGEKEFAFPVKNLQPWSPDDPMLYNMVLKISDDDSLIDVSFPVRFGFREVWTEGSELYLNGSRLVIRGSSHNYLSGYGFTERDIRLRKATGQNADRTDGSPQLQQLHTLNTCDEEGWLVFFQETPDKELLRLIGNHPSVIAWSLRGNGYVNGPHGHPMQIGGIIPEKISENNEHYRKIMELKEIDPTRLYFYYRLGAGGDFRSIMHYMGFGTPIQSIEEWPAYWAKTKQKPLVPSEISLMLFPAEARLWQKGSRMPVLLEHAARYFGDDAYAKVDQNLVGAYGIENEDLNKWLVSELRHDIKELVYQKALRSWRTYGINGYLLHVDGKSDHNTYTDGKLNRQGKTLEKNNSPFLFYIGGPKRDFVNKDHNYMPDRNVEKSLIIINDHFYRINGKIEWQITSRDETVSSGTEKFEAVPGAVKFIPFEWRTPSVTERTGFSISAQVKNEKGGILGEDNFDLTVFPEDNFSWNGRKPVALIDSTGETRQILETAGVPFQLVNEEVIDAGLYSLSKFDLLVIGKNSYTEAADLFKTQLHIREAVREGLNIVCLEQMNRRVMGLTTENFNTRNVFIRAADSPLFDGLKNEDFANWTGESRMLPAYLPWNEESDWQSLQNSKHGQLNAFGQRRNWHWSNKGTVATFSFEKPQLGNFRVLLDNGFDLLYTPLVEFYNGKGRILLSQLDMVDRYDVDPVSTLLMRRILMEYGQPGHNTFSNLSYIGGKKGGNLLEELNVAYREGIHSDVLLLSAMEFNDMIPATDIEKFISEGGTVVLSLENQETADLMPVKIKISEGWFYKTAIPPDHCFSGLGMSDFFFRQMLKLPLVKAIDGTTPESVVCGAIPYGKGRIIYIQIQPFLFNDPWQRTKALRIYNTVLTNIGIENRSALNPASISGLGTQKEWLPGYMPPEHDAATPVVKESNVYQNRALDFDPDQHHVW